MSFNPFTIGTKLHVETCFGEHITGDVVAYEHSVKMLILRCHSKDKKGNNCYNQSIVNLSFCKDLKILNEPKTTDKTLEAPARLNIQSLDRRLQKTETEREILQRSRNEHATPRGRQLFQLLSKHFGNHELIWQLDKIQVLKQIVIAPPYRICDITTTQHAPKLLNYVQRVLIKFDAQLAIADKEAPLL